MKESHVTIFPRVNNNRRHVSSISFFFRVRLRYKLWFTFYEPFHALAHLADFKVIHKVVNQNRSHLLSKKREYSICAQLGFGKPYYTIKMVKVFTNGSNNHANTSILTMHKIFSAFVYVSPCRRKKHTSHTHTHKHLFKYILLVCMCIFIYCFGYSFK